MKKISVLIVDDSALMRNLVTKIINNDPGLTVIGTAMNGKIALQKLEELKPDVITLDLEMPELNGIGFLKELGRRKIDMPIIVLSSLAKKGARITMQALDLGACDFITKPSGAISLDINEISKQLCEKIYAYFSHHAKKQGLALLGKKEEERPIFDPKNTQKEEEWPHYNTTEIPIKKNITPKIVCIGASTGGPFAIKSFLSEIPGDFPIPIVIVQHMPKDFTAAFAESLNEICTLQVSEATEGMMVIPGKVIIAPGNLHMTIEDRNIARVIRLSSEVPRNGHRPSVDVLFESIAKIYGDSVIAILMTGMGDDGAKELGTLFRAGATTIGQNQLSCVVYGMPKIAAEHGYVQYLLPLEEIPAKVISLAISH
ncbi:MAG: protein-glutamate methylesterase/protein-glutamine glutaminase [Spirochaetia bacterium]